MKHRLIFLAILFVLAAYGQLVPPRAATTAAHPTAASPTVHVAQQMTHNS